MQAVLKPPLMSRSRSLNSLIPVHRYLAAARLHVMQGVNPLASGDIRVDGPQPQDALVDRGLVRTAC
jgi:hypothetical protein